MRNAVTCAAVTAVLSCLAVPALAADPAGRWLTRDGNATVTIARCADAFCGTIVGLKEPNDAATGRPKTDSNNPDAGKRGRPLIGVQIVFAMKPSGTPEKWDGQVYNAEDGKTYTGSITLTGANTLDLKGCALGGLVCKTQTWTRTK